MKKKLLFIFTILLLIPCSFVLTACNGNPSPKEPTHIHNWDTTWSKDNTHHWYTCDSCDEAKSKKEHTPVNGTCSTCQYVLKTTESKKYIITYSHHFITYGNLGNSWGFGIKDNFTKKLLQNNEIYTFDLADGPSIIAIAVESDDGQDDVGYRVFEFSDISIGEEETKTLSFYVVENGGSNIGSRAEISFTITCKRVALDYDISQTTYNVNFMIPAGYTYTGKDSQQVIAGEYATAPVFTNQPNNFLGWSIDGENIISVSDYKINNDTLFIPIMQE